MGVSFIKYPEIGGIYSHYKGGKYEVITLANHSESGEVLVIYKSLHFGSVYARPLSIWFDIVDEKGDDHEDVVRFKFIGYNKIK